jgi:propanol-preferring alcohol dehydrogenase
VLACGVCRTDLHILERDLPTVRDPLIPGHQIVGEVIDGATDELPLGSRAGVSWIGGADLTCPFCRRGEENLCDAAVLTGYTMNGGYAEFALVRSDFAFPLPTDAEPRHLAPLLCAGIMGFRRARGTLRLRSICVVGHKRTAALGMRSLRLYTRRAASNPGGCRWGDLGRKRNR